METWNGSMVQRTPTGVWTLYPYLMPETLDRYGEHERHGKYAIAYSRDGWYVLDQEEGKILRWCPTEQGAIDYRLSLLDT